MTQTVLSSNGSLCIAKVDYNEEHMSFRKGELFQLSTNGWEVQSLETGHHWVIPIGRVGYSKLELLQLFEFLMTEKKVYLLYPVLQKIRNHLDSNERKASFFLQFIDDDPTLLVILRKEILRQYCK